MDPRPAATVIVARPSSNGIEVLVGRRGAASRFAPGFLVFPGGLVEPRDEMLAVRLYGDPGGAARACAVRELYEETGLVLGERGLVARQSGASIEDVLEGAPDPGSMVEIAHWVAPEFLEVRFDARFFAVPAPRGLDPTPDGVEIDRAWWAAPATVLMEHARGDAPLMWPTLVTLQALARCRSVDEVLALRVRQIPPPLATGLGPRRAATPGDRGGA